MLSVLVKVVLSKMWLTADMQARSAQCRCIFYTRPDQHWTSTLPDNLNRSRKLEPFQQVLQDLSQCCLITATVSGITSTSASVRYSLVCSRVLHFTYHLTLPFYALILAYLRGLSIDLIISSLLEQNIDSARVSVICRKVQCRPSVIFQCPVSWFFKFFKQHFYCCSMPMRSSRPEWPFILQSCTNDGNTCSLQKDM